MVDVLLTMNEASCIAGVEFPALRQKRRMQGIMRKNT
jgi:hypothetical protein